MFRGPSVALVNISLCKTCRLIRAVSSILSVSHCFCQAASMDRLKLLRPWIPIPRPPICGVYVTGVYRTLAALEPCACAEKSPMLPTKANASRRTQPTSTLHGHTSPLEPCPCLWNPPNGANSDSPPIMNQAYQASQIRSPAIANGAVRALRLSAALQRAAVHREAKAACCLQA